MFVALQLVFCFHVSGAEPSSDFVLEFVLLSTLCNLKEHVKFSSFFKVKAEREKKKS